MSKLPGSTSNLDNPDNLGAAVSATGSNFQGGSSAGDILVSVKESVQDKPVQEEAAPTSVFVIYETLVLQMAVEIMPENVASSNAIFFLRNIPGPIPEVSSPACMSFPYFKFA